MVEPVQGRGPVERFATREGSSSNENTRVQRERIDRLRDRAEIRQTPPLDPLDPAPPEAIDDAKGQNLDLIA